MSQRVRRNASPSSTKQGPMRATVPVSLMRQGSPPTATTSRNALKKISPSESPTSIWNVDSSRTKSQLSPDIRGSPEQRSPGSPNMKDSQQLYREKSKTLNLKSSTSPIIRRTASLDTIYLTGQWPRDLSHTYCGRPLVDKSTQTPDEWEELMDTKSHFSKQANPVSSGDRLKIRQRLQRSKESSRQTSASGQHHSPVHGDHSAISSSNSLNQSHPYTLPSTHSSLPVSRGINIPYSGIPRPVIPRMRNSVEGLNQEIEKLVLKGTPGSEDIDKQFHEPTPDGHRAPIADLLGRTRNVDTQTPSGAQRVGSCEDTPNGSPVSYCRSSSPFIHGAIDSSRPTSQNETDAHCHDPTPPYDKDDSKSASPEPTEVQLGTSPSINKFLAREPPDGCERVKIIEEPRKPQQIVFSPVAYLRPNPTNSAFKPSSSSAFYAPFKGYDQSTDTLNLAVLSHAAHSQPPATSIEG